MEYLINNWYIILGVLAGFAFTVYCLYTFFGMPSEKQKEKVIEWLIWACIQAEYKLESGTGQLKLREVYDMFCAVPAFKWVAKVISFKTFSEWVKEALTEAKKILVTNDSVAEYVYGKNKDREVAKIKEQIDL